MVNSRAGEVRSKTIAGGIVVRGLLVPGDDGYDDARTAWNLAVNQRPTAIVIAESAADVWGSKKSVTCGDQQLYAAGSYSLINPPSIGWRVIRFWLSSATGWVSRGGRRSRAPCGRRPLWCRR